MACNTSIVPIESTDYIGNSLETINTNFANLRDGINTNCINLLSAADVLGTLRSTVTTLQGYAQGRPKAWVVFDGTKDINGTYNLAPGLRKILATYNIEEVYKSDTGVYDVVFTENLTFVDPPPDELPAYAALATASTTTTLASSQAFAQPVNYEVDRLTVVVNDGQVIPNFRDSSRVTVAIF